MRTATLVLAVLGLLSVGPMFAAAQAQSPATPAAAYAAPTADGGTVITPVRWYAYRPVPAPYGVYRYPAYTYRPRAYWYGPRYYDYDYGYDRVVPYRSYYYPGDFEFQYYGPRRSFSFGF
jgi:hypothetical protein